MGLVILHCTVHGMWSPLMLVSDKLSVTFSGLAEDMYKPDVYRRTRGFLLPGVPEGFSQDYRDGQYMLLAQVDLAHFLHPPE